MVIGYYYFSEMITIKIPITINLALDSLFLNNLRVGISGNWKRKQKVHMSEVLICEKTVIPGLRKCHSLDMFNFFVHLSE